MIRSVKLFLPLLSTFTCGTLRDVYHQHKYDYELEEQAPVVQRVDSANHWINYYPLDNAINFDSTTDSAIHPLNNWGQKGEISGRL